MSCNASDPACAAAEVLALRKRLYAVRRDLGALACQHLGIGPTGMPADRRRLLSISSFADLWDLQSACQPLGIGLCRVHISALLAHR